MKTVFHSWTFENTGWVRLTSAFVIKQWMGHQFLPLSKGGMSSVTKTSFCLAAPVGLQDHLQSWYLRHSRHTCWAPRAAAGFTAAHLYVRTVSWSSGETTRPVWTPYSAHQSLLGQVVIPGLKESALIVYINQSIYNNIIRKEILPNS